MLRVDCVPDAAPVIGELFRRHFRADPPDFPIHYVSFYRASDAPIGYVHYTPFDDGYLCGGLVIDSRLYREIPEAHRNAIREAGGVAEHLMATTFPRLPNATAIWGYVGDVKAERVDLRVGFRHTEHPYVMVCWMRELAPDEKARRLERVIALGPF